MDSGRDLAHREASIQTVENSGATVGVSRNSALEQPCRGHNTTVSACEGPRTARFAPSFLTVSGDSYRYLSPATGSERAGVVLDTVGGYANLGQVERKSSVGKLLERYGVPIVP